MKNEDLIGAWGNDDDNDDDMMKMMMMIMKTKTSFFEFLVHALLMKIDTPLKLHFLAFLKQPHAHPQDMCTKLHSSKDLVMSNV